MKTILGVDLGTQAIKVIIYDLSSKSILQIVTSPLELISRHGGTREQHPHWWINGFQQCVQQLPTSLRDTVIAIGISGQQHGLVVIDRNGDVLAPAKLWCDTSTVTECEQLVSSADENCCLSTVGCITTGFTAPKIMWLRKHRPAVYSKMKTVLLPHDYLNFYLTGERVTECGDASGTGLLNIRTRAWSSEMLRLIDSDRDLTECLPRIMQPHEKAGNILPAIAERLGLPGNVIISAGGGDNMMAAIGTGNVAPGRLTASLGTSGTLFAYSKSAVIDESGFLAAFCSSTGGWLPLLCTMNCTVAIEHLRKLFSVNVERIEEMVGTIAPGCDGVLTIPFYNGERSPNLPHGKAVIFGLDGQNTTQGHLLRSAMEAAAFGLKAGLLAFQKHGMQFTQVTLTGGGSASAVWRQICADVLDLKVRVLKEKENAAFGAALQALWCYKNEIGEKSSLQDITNEHLVEDSEKGCTPGEAVLVYESVYRQYVELLDTVTPLFQRTRSDSN